MTHETTNLAYKDEVAEQIATALIKAFPALFELNRETLLGVLRLAATMSFMRALEGAIAALYLFKEPEDGPSLDTIAGEIASVAANGVPVQRGLGPLVA